ncbi:RSP_2647 family RNA methyltransferase [Algirhabdus cladophorae]|uniref:RSP_2647 family RNA methyltransferase n=1 Tax=Algirhabdus cladophorae TaxID=3377108 RepID=UPI003B84A6C3
MTHAPLPVVRLKPKTDARRLRFGHPWVYDNELVTDRRTKAIAPGSLAVVEDAGRQVIGLAAINPNSKLFARLLDPNPETVIDQAWFAAKLTTALAHRDRMFAEPFYRLIHAEADGLPGVIIDRFGDTIVIQPNAAWADTRVDELAAAVVDVTKVSNVLKNAAGRARSLEGLDDESAVLHGAAPTGPVPVPMNGAVYMADLTGGQKTGLFFDQRPNQAFLQSISKDARVLDVFSHVGGFGLAALAAGADSAIAVDGSEAALDLATQGAAAMGKDGQFSTQKGDAFDVMAQLTTDAATFDVVICDPPAFAPSRKSLEAGLRAYEKTAKMASALAAPQGYLVLCSCSHAAELSKFQAACTRGIGRAGRQAQLIHTGYAGADHPLMPALAESGYLKALFFRMLD